MNIYIAAPWKDRGPIPWIASELEDRGHKITHKWWEYEGTDQTAESHEFLRECAIHDVEGVLNADVVLLINSSKSEGKAVEQGLAIAAGKTIIGVGQNGESMNVFHHLDNYKWVEGIEAAYDAIEQEANGNSNS